MNTLLHNNIRIIELQFLKRAIILIIAEVTFYVIFDFYTNQFVPCYIALTILFALIPTFYAVSFIKKISIFKTLILYYLLCQIFISILVYDYFPEVLVKMFTFFTLSLFFYNIKKSILIVSTTLLVIPLGNLYHSYFPFEHSLTPAQIQIRSFIFYNIQIIMLVYFIYYLLEVKKHKAVLNYIENNKIELEDIYFHGLNIDLELSTFNSKEINQNTNKSLNLLFSEIQDYLSNEKPWMNPEFTIEELAKAMKSNSTYVSHAISQNSQTNFKNFINQHRIDAFLEEIKKNKDLSFKEIYYNIGFNSQSTFNRAFKLKLKMSPLEYLENLKK